MKNFLSLTLIILFLSSCTRPVLDFSVPNVVPSKRKINLAANYIEIQGGEEPHTKIAFSEELLAKYSKEGFSRANIIGHWVQGLADALQKARLFEKTSPQKAYVFVKIQELDLPVFGFSLTSRVSATYQLRDRQTDQVLYEDTITSDCTVPGSYAFLATTRAEKSLNEAVQKNISSFVSNLQEESVVQGINSDLDKLNFSQKSLLKGKQNEK